MTDFIETLLKMDITTGVVTNQSTLLIDVIYGLTALGCTMSGLNKFTMKNELIGKAVGQMDSYREKIGCLRISCE